MPTESSDKKPDGILELYASVHVQTQQKCEISKFSSPVQNAHTRARHLAVWTERLMLAVLYACYLHVIVIPLGKRPHRYSNVQPICL